MATVDERISGLIKFALSNKQVDKSVFIGKIPTAVAEMVKKSCGRNITGYSLIMDTRAIRHIHKRHPDVALRDFLLIPFILRDPVLVKTGSQNDTILFKKTLVMEYSCVELIVDKSKSLRLKTFYFDKPKKTPRA